MAAKRVLHLRAWALGALLLASLSACRLPGNGGGYGAGSPDPNIPPSSPSPSITLTTYYLFLPGATCPDGSALSVPYRRALGVAGATVAVNDPCSSAVAHIPVSAVLPVDTDVVVYNAEIYERRTSEPLEFPSVRVEAACVERAVPAASRAAAVVRVGSDPAHANVAFSGKASITPLSGRTAARSATSDTLTYQDSSYTLSIARLGPGMLVLSDFTSVLFDCTLAP